jgi:Mg2+ and Co2+ transporter CorA
MQILDTVDLDAIRALHEREEFFWLDLLSPTAAELDELGGILGIPELAIEDSKEFEESPKLDDYSDRVLIVFYGAHGPARRGPRARLEQQVVSVRRAPCAHLEARKRRPRTSAPSRTSSIASRCAGGSLRTSPTATRRGRVEEIAFVRLAGRPPAHGRAAPELFRLQQIVIPQRDAGRGDVLEKLPGLERDIALLPRRA